jgi:phage major head subunit gpT-like protein
LIINSGNLKNAGIGFNAAFKTGLTTTTSQYALIATTVPSTTKKNEYGWLNMLPQVREWLGDRQSSRVAASGYTVTNRDWEITLEVDRNDFEDDNLGIYTPMLQMMGGNTTRHYDRLTFGALKSGFAAGGECFDGQYFFDTDHPILAEDGTKTTFANTDGGDGAPWFLIAKNQPLLPVLLQKRRDYSFVSKAAPNDDNVFYQKKFVYGADARYATGYTLPQLCWGSKQPLDTAHFNAAMQSMLGMKLDYGVEIANAEFRMVVGASNRAAAQSIIQAQFLASGASNTNYQAAELAVSPYLD